MSTVFWDIQPFSPLKCNGSLGGTHPLQLQSQGLSRMKKQCESKWQAEPHSEDASVAFQRTIWRYVREGTTLHYHRYENLEFYIDLSCSKPSPVVTRNLELIHSIITGV
jgi:hypothetical protein